MKNFYVNFYESMPGHIVARGPAYTTRTIAENDVLPQEKTLFLGTFAVQVPEGLLDVTPDGLVVKNRQNC